MARIRTEQAKAKPSRLILDAGAVIALARGVPSAVGFLKNSVELLVEIIVPPVVVAETVRGHGPRDAPVNRVLASVNEVPATTEGTGRIAGELLEDAGSGETIDALVVATALEAGGGRILTSDSADMRRLASGKPEVTVIEI